jgi:hypothetical protein
MACWLVLAVGKGQLYAKDVASEDMNSFRRKPYACSYAPLNELHAAAKVCSAEALFGRTATKSFTSPALLVRVVV